MTVYDSFFYGVFTLKIAIHPRRVEICKASFKKSVNHLFCEFHVYFSGVVWVCDGKAHKPEAELLFFHSKSSVLIFDYIISIQYRLHFKQ